MVNTKDAQTFQGGWSTDMHNQSEKKTTYEKGENGRLYSKNGVLSFSAAKGTKLVYENSNIVRYLGYHSFFDESIIFAKILKYEDSTGGPTTITKCTTVITGNKFTLAGPPGAILSVTDQMTQVVDENELCVEVSVNEEDLEAEFGSDFSYSEEDEEEIEIDFGIYYRENPNVPNFLPCNSQLDSIPRNNELYDDAIFSLKKTSDGNYTMTLLWKGQQNWPLEGKISCEGVDENQFYKRVYYTDAVNIRRVINIKDPGLYSRDTSEFAQVINNVLLQPEIISIEDGGQLKSMKALYLYRVISENGQVSEFSPTSFFAKIVPESEAIEYRGGAISELTSKVVTIQCPILNHNPTSEIECIALEFEAEGSPTAIRNLGKQTASPKVEFKHFGNEAEFADDITYQDIINYTNSWKYCNDYSSKKNKLIAAGLRSEPLPEELSNLEYLFPLHSWNAAGETHDSLMNPKPWEYRMIDPSYEGKLVYVRKKIYRSLSSFGPSKITFLNKVSGESIELNVFDLPVEGYTDVMSIIIEWLLKEQSNNAFEFTTKFPNLKVTSYRSQLLFEPVDDSIQTDFADYVIESDNEQFINAFDNSLRFLESTVDVNNLVWGAQSIGFNEGNGIRISYRESTEPLLNQATAPYDGSGPVLDYIKPSGEKYAMKGEIYRLALNGFNNNSTRMFAIPLGDIFVPENGEEKKWIDDNGNAHIEFRRYEHQKVGNGQLIACGIKLHIEVRISCELQKQMPMYQLVYVERDENNRTILCQGIGQPLNRVQHTGDDEFDLKDPVKNKWNIPYYGGPVYEKQALLNYDDNGENYNYTGGHWRQRTINHRGLFYFDSPDIYYGRISDQFVNSSVVDVIAKLKTDHTPDCIVNYGKDFHNYRGGVEVYPKFSRKIREENLEEGLLHLNGLPGYPSEENYNTTLTSYFVNVSVFAQHIEYRRQHNINKAAPFLRGEEGALSGSGLTHTISNNTFGLSCQPWYYGLLARKMEFFDGQKDRPRSLVFDSSIVSPAYPTIVIKTEDDLFTEEFTGDIVGHVNPNIREGDAGRDIQAVYDTTPLINLYRNNRESVYGGRSEEAYSKNTYIPLTRTIPVLENNNGIQMFETGIDTYMTLNIRTKNDNGDAEPQYMDRLNNHDNGRDKGEIRDWQRHAAWTYAVVLETQVEPKDTYGYEFYKITGLHAFDKLRYEDINKAYFNENNIKSYVPKPYRFKDDPDQGHVVAVSDVKLAGEFFDAWTVFKANNFYAELERDKGDIMNLVKFKDKIYAIQRGQTSFLAIGVDRVLTDQEGKPINIKQGSGTVVEGHEVIANFGSNIRNNAIESDKYGFTFFDERKIEFVRNGEALFEKNFLHLEMFERFKNDPIIDVANYFDQENKESNVRVRTKSGLGYSISYNEKLGCFNGIFPYNADVFIMFDEKVFAPIRGNEYDDHISEDLHQLNAGETLNFFGKQYDMKLGFIVHANIDKVIQYKQLGVITNLDYPVKWVKGFSNLGYDRIISGSHQAYKIREGIHTLPMINDTIINEESETADIRGSWIYLEICAESLNNNKIDILGVINHIRISHL